MWWCHLLLGIPLVIGGLFVFLPWSMALPLALVLAVGTAVIGYYATRALRQPAVTGIGDIGVAVSDLTLEGLVRVGSELWVAEAPEPVSEEARVEVVEVHGAKMKVRSWGPKTRAHPEGGGP